jgi:hypothetical protein
MQVPVPFLAFPEHGPAIRSLRGVIAVPLGAVHPLPVVQRHVPAVNMHSMNSSIRSEVKCNALQAEADPVPCSFDVAFLERPQRCEQLGALFRGERDGQR